MSSTITIGDALLLLIGVCAVILLIYLIRILRALLPSLKTISSILDDASSITGVASNAVTGAEDAVNSMTVTAGDMSEFITENQSTIKALVSFVNAVVALKKIFGDKKS